MTTPRLQTIGMIPVFQMEHNRVYNHKSAAAPPALRISAEMPHPYGTASQIWAGPLTS